MPSQQNVLTAINSRRQALGMTVKDLYSKAGISKATYFRKTTGVGELTLSDLDKLAAALGCTVEILLMPRTDGRQ